LSSRRLLVLVDNLPRESATARAVHGEQLQWGHTEHLLADVVDLLRILVWQMGGKGQRPDPIPRPGQANDRSTRTELTVVQQQARLLELQARERQRQGELQQQQTTSDEEVTTNGN
jgi:hypothetical protein